MKKNNKIENTTKSRTSYQISLLQARAYRIIKQHTSGVLSEFGISTIDWGFLGLLYGNKKGFRLSAIADELGVEAPFVTTLVTKLIKKEVVTYSTDPEDNRAKIVILTPQGKTFVQNIEKIVKDKIKPIVKDIPANDFIVYLNVLKNIIENYKALEVENKT